MIDMEKDFIPYDRALRMKALGFDEPCLGLYYDDGKTSEFAHVSKKGRMTFLHNSDEPMRVTKVLYQQAFRWFREEYDLFSYPYLNEYQKFGYRIMERKEPENEELFYDWGTKDAYEEAELACLDKLLEIVESKS